MPFYRNDHHFVLAIRWFLPGDHKHVSLHDPTPLTCEICGRSWHEHGILVGEEEVVEGPGTVVHPGDWVATDAGGRVGVHRPGDFETNYTICGDDEL